MAEHYDKDPEAKVEGDGGLRIITPKFAIVKVTDPITGETVELEIKQWTLGQLAFVAELIVQFGLSISSIGANLSTLSPDDLYVIVSLLMQKADVLWKVMAYSLKREVAWVEGLDAEEGFDVAYALVLVNKSFFRRLQTLLPNRAASQVEGQASSEATMTGAVSSAS